MGVWKSHSVCRSPGLASATIGDVVRNSGRLSRITAMKQSRSLCSRNEFTDWIFLKVSYIPVSCIIASMHANLYKTFEQANEVSKGPKINSAYAMHR